MGAAIAAVLVLLVAGACGSGEGDGQVGSGAPSSTTVVAAEPGGTGAPSPVDGLTADQLQAAVDAVAADRAPLGAPTAEQVTVAGVGRVWRVVVPGTFPPRSARAVVLVDGREVGVGIELPDASGLVAVTADGAALRPGAPVTIRYGRSSPVAVGTLVVRR